MTEKYDPIACGLYDRLEAEATLKHTVRLTVKEDDGAVHQVIGLIRTFSAHNGVEHLIMEDNTKIRLDKVTHLNGQLFVADIA